MHVISLSSIPPRFGALAEQLEALLAQRRPAEEIRLYIPRRYRRFPDWDGRLPEVPRGIRICRAEEDLGPATKVLFAAEELRGQDLGLLYCDDDRTYAPEWSHRLLRAWRRRPQGTIASCGWDLDHLGLPLPEADPQPRFGLQVRRMDPEYRYLRTRQRIGRLFGGAKGPKPQRNLIGRSGHCHVAEGFGGVLIRPDWLPQEAWQIPPVLWAVDDVWLSGHLTRTGHAPWLPARAHRLRTGGVSDVAALADATLDGAGRAEANLRCARHFIETYGIWK